MTGTQKTDPTHITCRFDFCNKNRRHPDSVPRFSIPLRKAYNGQAPHTVARQLRIFTVFPARSPIDFCSFYLIVFILIRMIIIRSRKNSYSLYLFQSICLLLHRRKAPAKQGIVPIYVSQELFCPFPFLAGSSDEIGTVPVNDTLPIRKTYQNLRRMPTFSFHFLWKSPPRSLAKSA